jgi:hypothetical protein
VWSEEPVGVGWGLSCFLCVLFLCSFFLTFLSFPYVLLFPFIYLLLFISFCLFPFVYFSLLFRSDFPFPSLRSFLSFCLSSFVYLLLFIFLFISFCLFPYSAFFTLLSLLSFLLLCIATLPAPRHMSWAQWSLISTTEKRQDVGSFVAVAPG